MRLTTKLKLDYFGGGLVLLALYPAVRLLGLILRRNHKLTPVKHIAVIKLLGAGSVYLALPALRAIKLRNPQTRISLVCGPGVRALAESLGCFDQIRVIDDRGPTALARSSLSCLSWLAREADCLIDLEVHSRLSTAFAVLSGVRNRIGFYDEVSFWRKRLYTHCVYFNIFSPVYEFYDGLAALFGAETLELASFHKEIAERVRAPLPIELPERFIAVGAGCSDLGQERQLKPEFWQELLQEAKVKLPGTSWVFLGAASDRPIAEAACTGDPDALNLCGKLPLAQSFAVLARAQAFVGIDSLLLHVARTLCPVVASFWGPTAPATRLRPMPIRELISYERISCSPCIHVSESPPCDSNNICMRPHAPAATLEFLSSASGSARSADLSVRASGAWVTYPDQSRAVHLEIRT